METKNQTEFPGLSAAFMQENEKYIRKVQDLCLLDDEFLCKVFEDKECTQLVLRIILDKTDLEVLNVRSRYSIEKPQGRSARLDIWAVDREGKNYNVEIQRQDVANARRARYNSSVQDVNLTYSGDHYGDLRETYVVFITKRDILKAGLPIYHIDRMIRETGTSFGDGAHIIYVNAECKDDTPLGRLMHDFACTKANDMHYPILADRVRYFKENEEGARKMCHMFEEYGLVEWYEGRVEGFTISVRNLMKVLCFPAEAVMELLDMSEYERTAVRAEIVR